MSSNNRLMHRLCFVNVKLIWCCGINSEKCNVWENQIFTWNWASTMSSWEMHCVSWNNQRLLFWQKRCICNILWREYLLFLANFLFGIEWIDSFSWQINPTASDHLKNKCVSNMHISPRPYGALIRLVFRLLGEPPLGQIFTKMGETHPE